MLVVVSVLLYLLDQTLELVFQSVFLRVALELSQTDQLEPEVEVRCHLGSDILQYF